MEVRRRYLSGDSTREACPSSDEGHGVWSLFEPERRGRPDVLEAVKEGRGGEQSRGKPSSSIVKTRPGRPWRGRATTCSA